MTNPLKLTVFSTSFPRNSGDEAGIFVARLIDALGRLGHSGVIVVPLDDQEPDGEERGTFHVRRFRYGLFFKGSLAFGAGVLPNIRRNPFLCLQIPGLILGNFFAALRHARESQLVLGNWLISALPAYLLKLATGKPYAIIARGEDIRVLRNRFVRAILWFPLQSAKAIVAVSYGASAELERSLKRRVEVIENGVDRIIIPANEYEKFLHERGLHPEQRHLLYVGRVIPSKRVEELLEVLALLPDYSLMICGRTDQPDYLQQLKARAIELGVSERVRWEGVVKPELIPFYLKICSAFITASEYEGRPNALLEALSAGAVVLASDIPAHREVVEHGKNGCIFKKPEEVVEFLKSLDEETRGRLGDAAIDSVRWLSWDATAFKYSTLFNKMLANPQSDA